MKSSKANNLSGLTDFPYVFSLTLVVVVQSLYTQGVPPSTDKGPFLRSPSKRPTSTRIRSPSFRGWPPWGAIIRPHRQALGSTLGLSLAVYNTTTLLTYSSTTVLSIRSPLLGVGVCWAGGLPP